MKRRSYLALAAGVGGVWYLRGPQEDRPDEDSGDGSNGSGFVGGGAPDRAATATALRERINAAREEIGVATLRADGGLDSVARDHAVDMHERAFYAHENPDGEQPWERAVCGPAETLHRGEFTTAMQNIGSEREWDTTTAAGLASYVVAGWTLSESHYQIMTAADHTRVGIGLWFGETDFFAVANYC